MGEDLQQGRGFARNADNHHVQHVLDGDSAIFEVLHIALKSVRQEKPGACDHPIIGIADEQDVANPFQRRG